MRLAPPLLVPGVYEDAYVYMGYLFLLDEHHDIVVISLDELIDTFEVPSFAEQLTRGLFVRNDHLRGVITLMTAARTLADGLDAVAAIGGRVNRRSIRRAAVARIRPNLGASVVLDWTIYNCRVYIGSDAGMHHVDLDIDDDVEAGASVRRFDARTYAITVKFGSVNASCGEEGLFSTFDDFGWLDHARYPDPELKEQMSARAVWSDYDLINYRALIDAPVALRSSHTRIADQTTGTSEDRERNVVVGYTARVNLEHILVKVLGELHAAPEEVEYIYNSNRAFFVKTRGRGIASAAITRSAESIDVRAVRERGEDSGRVIGMSSASVAGALEGQPGVLIEQEYNTLLFTGGDFLVAHPGEAISVRTYPRSMHYRHLATVTDDSGVWLVPLYVTEE